MSGVTPIKIRFGWWKIRSWLRTIRIILLGKTPADLEMEARVQRLRDQQLALYIGDPIEWEEHQ